MNSFPVGSFTIGDGSLTIIGGPCLAESQGLCEDVCGTLQSVCAELGLNYIFKASFDKANRTSAGSVRGAGQEAGLAIIESIGNKFGVPTTTDIHLPSQAAEVCPAGEQKEVPPHRHARGIADLAG